MSVHLLHFGERLLVELGRQVGVLNRRGELQGRRPPVNNNGRCSSFLTVRRRLHPRGAGSFLSLSTYTRCGRRRRRRPRRRLGLDTEQRLDHPQNAPHQPRLLPRHVARYHQHGISRVVRLDDESTRDQERLSTRRIDDKPGNLAVGQAQRSNLFVIRIGNHITQHLPKYPHALLSLLALLLPAGVDAGKHGPDCGRCGLVVDRSQDSFVGRRRGLRGSRRRRALRLRRRGVGVAWCWLRLVTRAQLSSLSCETRIRVDIERLGDVLGELVERPRPLFHRIRYVHNCRNFKFLSRTGRKPFDGRG